MSSPLGSSSNLIITLGVFLKILGFFVILYSYSEFVPSKVTQAEQSLQQRFSINIQLPTERSGQQALSISAVQNVGRSFTAIAADLKTQMDLFSVEHVARSNELVLDLPADQVISLNGKPALSHNLDKVLVDTLKKNQAQGYQYRLGIIGVNGPKDDMMRGLGNFVQTIVADNYPQSLLTIGYDARDNTAPIVEFHIEAVPK